MEEDTNTFTGCFGCGESNAEGLQLTLEGIQGGARAHASFCEVHAGHPGIVHGGIQATFLDEVMGKAVDTEVERSIGSRVTVTATLELRYRRPCPTNSDLRAEAWVERVDLPSIHVGARIVDADENVLTEATARWHVVEGGAASVTG